MSNVYKFPVREPALPPVRIVKIVEDNLHIREPESYSIEDLGIGIEIALAITRQPDTAKFLLTKIAQAVNQGVTEIPFTLHETRKYLDYVDIVNSPTNTQLRIQLHTSKFT